MNSLSVDELEKRLQALEQKCDEQAFAPPTPISDGFGDSVESFRRRQAWPEFSVGTLEDLQAGASLFQVRGKAPTPVMWMLQEEGLVRFCEPREGSRALVLRTICGRSAEAWKLDGTPWQSASGWFHESWRLPGSLSTVPLVLGQLPKRGPIAIAVGSSFFVHVVAMLLAAGREDCGVVCFQSWQIPIFHLRDAAIKMLAGRRVRFFPTVDVDCLRMVASWTADLTRAGCEVDTFDFSKHLVMDAKGYAWIPDEFKATEVMP